MIAITGGGTGGHLSIAKAVKEALNELGVKPIFIGSVNGQDRSWFENDNGFSKAFFLNSGGVVNQKGFGKFRALGKIASCAISARKVLQENGVKNILSVGGYSAAPCVFASIGKNLFIHEQNATIGSLNKLARPYAKGFFCSFDKNADYNGYPVSKIYFENARVRSDIKTVIFLGGSQGALAINSFALSIAKDLQNLGIKIIHQCGIKHEEAIKAEYQKLEIDADVFGFSKELVQKIASSDFAVARAGAGTLFELAANGLPSLFVPYPYAACNHQYYNAKFLADRNLAHVCLQDELEKSKFLDLLTKDFSGISKNLISVNAKDAAMQIAKRLLCNA
ncbi:MAG: undecaprenyldiphospho-muramoylpentapeptide beta-N-acetylglucosaminyltransferase [Pseudomonadota bacterium]|jgi:UDP-N-acetylglucosamine--N-acetylmuramyl-(pentapeptide) pyrophosphoryl-undecaprenol N-acetylglucosamine transferase